MVYYLGTDSEAPLLPVWDKATPAFYVSSVEGAELEYVRAKLPHRNLRYLGSHNGCGCGFRSFRDGMLILNDAELADVEADHAALSRYLARLEKRERPHQILGCWSGDEREPANFERRVTAADLLAPEFGFRERELLTIDQ